MTSNLHITFVKKILATGEPCPKCADVQERLEKAGQMDQIDKVVIADERDPGSEGMQLARDLGVERAPFFVVEEAEKEPRVYTVYFKFAKEVLGKSSSKSDEAKEILNDNPDLDFI
jgi:hypothetical protein